MAAGMVKQLLPKDWAQIISSHVVSTGLLADGKAVAALNEQMDACEKLLDVMLSKANQGSNWYLPVLDVVVLQLRLCAYSADAGVGSGNKHQRDVAQKIQEFFGPMAKDSAQMSNSRKMGGLIIANHLFKMYFRINLLKQVGHVRRNIETRFPPLDEFPKSQTVTYTFYLGRLQVMAEQYAEAEESLGFALRHCHKDSKANKARILQYLVPVRLLRGMFPAPRLLQKYNFPQFQQAVAAIKAGDLRSYNVVLREHEDFFISRGIFLILEKLKKLVYRNLIRKVHTIMRNDESVKRKEQIKLSYIRAAFSANGVEMPEEHFDEIECILANLIYRGYIRGFIAHNKCLVVSAKDPFPKVSSFA